MPVRVFGTNHVAIEVDDAEKAVEFYQDVFNLKMLRGGEGAAWCQLGEHQFMAIFEVDELRPDRSKHFGLMVRDDDQIAEVREKITKNTAWRSCRTSAVTFAIPGATGSR